MPVSYYQDGTGSPEGAVTAGVSTLWAQHDGANGAVTWRKISGAGNTGWEELQGVVGVVRPEEYGAVGNDSADDTTPMQNAITAAVSAKKRLLCRRQYKITDTLTVSGSLLLEGNGYESVIHQTTREKNVFEITGPNVTVQHIRLRGDNGTTGSSITKNNGAYVNGAVKFRMLNCWAHEFEAAGVQIVDCSDVLIAGCFFFDNVWGEFDDGSDILCSSTSEYISRRITIAQNHCLSNNSQGIYVNPNNADCDVAVIGNVCVTLDGDGDEIASGSLLRRHGILTTYHGGTVGGRIVVADNICRNTAITGIYYNSTVDPSSPVIIANNYVSKAGVIDDANWGGISMIAQGQGSLVIGNTVEDIVHGPGISVTAGDSDQTGKTVIANNIIRRCTSSVTLEPAMLLGQEAENVLVTGNQFLDNSTRDLVVAANASSDTPGDIVVRGNFFHKTEAQVVMEVDMADSTKLVLIEDNYVVGSGAATIAVRFATPTIIIKRNTFVGCLVGIEAAAYTATGRHADYPQIDYNTFRDCTNGIRVGASVTTATQVLEGNTFVGSFTNAVQDWIGGGAAYKSGYIGQRCGSRIVIDGTAAPTLGTWAVGDEVGSTLPGKSGPSRTICATAGTPGSWTAVGFAHGMVVDCGDANITLTVGVDPPTQRFSTTLTANRTVTLATTNAVNGDRFRVVRQASGAFTLNVGGLKTIPGNTAAFVDVEFSGFNWILTGYGLL